MISLACIGGALFGTALFPSMDRDRFEEEDHVIVTGGSSGIGRSMAMQMASMGAKITLIARGEASLSEAIEAAPPHAQVQAKVADVTNFEALRNAFEEAKRNFGPITMLVCAAGFAVPARMEDARVEDMHAMVNVNYLGAIHAAKAAWNDIEAAGRKGRIMLVASQAAQVGVYGLGAYSGTKWALRGLGEALAMELAPSGARVCVAFPPDTDTPGFAKEEVDKPDETRYISGSDAPWRPEDVARCMVKGLRHGDFQVTCGVEGWALGVLTCGFAPPNSFLGAVTEVFLLGIMRVVALILSATWMRKVKQMSASRSSRH